MLVGSLRGDRGICHKRRHEEDEEKDRVARAQVLQQLKSCVGIHDEDFKGP